MTSGRQSWALALALATASCIPAGAPAHLDATPGPAVVVAGGVVDAGAFRASYPPGWRVITAPAGATPFVLLVAPDNCALIRLGLSLEPAPLVAPACGAERALARVAGGTPPVHVSARAPAAGWDAFTRVVDAVIASVVR
jgi:hypothetical protein